MRFYLGILAGLAALSATEAAAARYTASKVLFQDITGEVIVTTTGGEDVEVNIRQGATHHPVSVSIADGELVIKGERWRDDETRNCCDTRINRTENLARDRKSGRRTIVSSLGVPAGRFQIALMCLLPYSLCVCWTFAGAWGAAFLPLLTLPLAVWIIRDVNLGW